MDIQRNLLTISLVAISAILYFKWIDYSAITEQGLSPEARVADTGVPSTPTSQMNGQDGVPTTPTNSSALTGDLPSVPGTQAVSSLDSLIIVETDMVRATINTNGGVIESLELKNYALTLDYPEQGFPLLKKSAVETFVAQDGLLSTTTDGSPTHKTQYQSSGLRYSINGQDQVLVPLTWRSGSGVEFIKTFTFRNDSFLVDIDYRVNNQSDAPWTGYLYAQFNRSIPADSGGGFGRLPSYTGGAYYTTEDKYQKVDFGDMDDANLDIENKGGWVAMLQHYFVGAWIPGDEVNKFYTSMNKQTGLYRVGYKTTVPVQIEVGQLGNLSTRAYLGSKDQSRLKIVQESGVAGLTRSVDYGFLTFIADPLFTVLSWIHDVVGNWGWAIILLTILIKLMFYPLSAASYRSMGKMKKLQPRMATLKERYKDDRQKFQVEMMAMYKKEKVNPAGGCLPILIQIPVFIALYWVLLESVEMRHAPFALWWVDLSAKDPYYVLPVLMGVSMFFMQKLNPAPMDDIQKKVMMIMPFALTFLFMTFPQGLVLYWVVNNVLTMAQQWFNYRQQENG
ncbi:MAG: YidC/Oxa1 family membrane protein insertase [Arenicella sp.]|jgi:YidC/Oxa1 family membrane protein insertase